VSVKRISSFLIWLCAFSFCTLPKSLASVGFQPVNPDELKMTSDPLAPGAPAIILERDVYRDDFGRQSHGGAQVNYNTSTRYEDNYFRIKILTEEGRKYGDVEIQLLPFYRDVTEIKARTIHPDGTIEEFHGQIFQKTLAKKQGYGPVQAKAFTIPNVQVGSIVEYYYTVEFNGYLIFFSDWIVSHELFQKHAKFSLRPYTVEGSHVNMHWTQHLPPGVPEPKQGPDNIVRLEVSNIPAFRSEEFMPPEDELKARVDFIYSYEAIDPDMNHFWKSVGKKRNGELESFVSKRNTLEAEVGQIVSPADAPEVKLQKIYARVQKLRNTSYEEEKTKAEKKEEKENELHNAEDVLKAGYGSEEQLNWLFLGLARAAGFDSHGLSVSDRSEFFFNPQLMDVNRLDHSAVVIPLNGKDTYFAPGAAFAPFGMLRWQQTGVTALRLDKDGGSWVQTGVPESSLSQVERRAEFKLRDSGDLEGKVTVTYTGLEGLKRRVEERNEDEVARKKYLEDEVKNSIPAASEVQLSNTPEWANTDRPLVAEFSVKVPGWVARGGKLAMCPLGVFGANERHIFDPADRTYPIYFAYPAQHLDDIFIELPAGWQATSLPKPLNYDYHVVAYSVGVEDGKTKLHLKRKLDINIVLLDSKYYSPIRSFFQGVKAGDSQQIILQPGTAVSSN